MDTGIGAAAALNADGGIAEETAQFIFHHFLNGDTVILPLPSMVHGSVIRDDHFECAESGVFCCNCIFRIFQILRHNNYPVKKAGTAIRYSSRFESNSVIYD
jgi:hypothetical protein